LAGGMKVKLIGSVVVHVFQAVFSGLDGFICTMEDGLVSCTEAASNTQGKVQINFAHSSVPSSFRVGVVVKNSVVARLITGPFPEIGNVVWRRFPDVQFRGFTGGQYPPGNGDQIITPQQPVGVFSDVKKFGCAIPARAKHDKIRYDKFTYTPSTADQALNEKSTEYVNIQSSQLNLRTINATLSYRDNFPVFSALFEYTKQLTAVVSFDGTFSIRAQQGKELWDNIVKSVTLKNCRVCLGCSLSSVCTMLFSRSSSDALTFTLESDSPSSYVSTDTIMLSEPNEYEIRILPYATTSTIKLHIKIANTVVETVETDDIEYRVQDGFDKTNSTVDVGPKTNPKPNDSWTTSNIAVVSGVIIAFVVVIFLLTCCMCCLSRQRTITTLEKKTI
jgi:hypothetical protein